MKHDDEITIEAIPEAVWAYVGYPERWPEFHEKIIIVECASPREGEPIELLLNFGKEQVLCKGTITEYLSNELIQGELWGRSTGMRGELPVRFTVSMQLTPSGNGSQTNVLEHVDFDVKLPWWARVLVWWIEKFGVTVGKTQLQKLKELVEKPN